MIFRFQDHLYETAYSQGATEQQDTHPYDYEPDEIECFEVKPVERITYDYVLVEDAA